MGQAISSILESFDNQEEKKKEANDALNALMTMAEDKAKLHYQEVISSALDAKKVPVRKVIVRLSNIHCGVSKNADGLKDTLSGTIRNFVKGEIVDGLVGVASQALDTLMGRVSANKSELTNYAISVGNIGGIQRVDFYMFYYKYTSDSLTKVTEDCLIYSLIISSVEIGDLIDEDVRTIVQTTYSTPLPNEAPEDTKKREETIVAMVEEEIKKNKPT